MRRLHAEVKAACPNMVGVSSGDLSDRSTWRVHFDGSESDQERAAAAAVLAAFNINAIEPTSTLESEVADLRSRMNTLLQAIGDANG